MTKLKGFVVKLNSFQNEKFVIRRGATPHRRFFGSVISRRRKPAFHMRSIFHLPNGQISLRGYAAALRSEHFYISISIKSA
jgi:hypothetical protein